jgi:hypothetical protein
VSLIKLSVQFEQIKSKVASTVVQDLILSDDFKTSYRKYVLAGIPNGYAEIEWVKYSAKIRTSNGKTIWLPNFWFFVASELASYLDALERHRAVFFTIFSGLNYKTVADELRAFVSTLNREKIEQHFSSNGMANEELENFIQFVSNYDAWGGGKTIDRNDFYVSALMKAGNLLAETQSGIAEIAMQLYEKKDVWDKLRNSLQLHLTDVIGIVDVVHQQSGNLPKSFILLAGISGTGKTRFVREQAIISDGHCKMIPVRPDWHEPSDLLGYVSRIGGTPKYIPTEALQFIAQAWKNAYSSANENLLSLKSADEMLPFWLCLDEMNLAPVEQYFADYLSILETREWDGVGKYSCDSILKLSEPNMFDGLRLSLGLSDTCHDGLWSYFSKHGIPIPPNLIVAGTVNMDETTHGFSRKVVDRALTFDFGEFFPNDFSQFFSSTISVKKLSFPKLTHVSKAHFENVSADLGGSRSISFLESLNSITRGTPFELAYRALNELLLAVVAQNPANDGELLAVWDDFVMMKVLPRIEGDNEKLGGTQNDGSTVIDRLLELLTITFAVIEGGRSDFYRQNIDGSPVVIPVRSLKKIRWMKNRLSNNGFTSFWP